MREVITTNNAPVLNVPLSQGIKIGNVVYASGQVGVDPETGIVHEGFEAQTRQTLSNLLAVIEAGGAKKENIVKTTVFLTDIRMFEVFNRIYREYFDVEPPARSAFEVSALAGPYDVEVEAIAYIE